MGFEGGNDWSIAFQPAARDKDGGFNFVVDQGCEDAFIYFSGASIKGQRHALALCRWGHVHVIFDERRLCPRIASAKPHGERCACEV